VARKRLRTNLWRIRTVVEPSGVPKGAVLNADARDVGLNRGGIGWLDVDEFEERLRRIPSSGQPLHPSELESLEAAASLYQGDLLEGNYDDWCLYERERLKAMFHQALHRLIAHRASHNQWDEAIVTARELLRQDPLQERIHRDLMRFYYLAGNRPAALQQYGKLKRMLRQELDVPPVVETEALFQAIHADDDEAVDNANGGAMPARPSHSASKSVSEPPTTMLDDLMVASRELESARRRVRRSIVDMTSQPDDSG